MHNRKKPVLLYNKRKTCNNTYYKKPGNYKITIIFRMIIY